MQLQQLAQRHPRPIEQRFGVKCIPEPHS
jgi:hypothetical protein